MRRVTKDLNNQRDPQLPIVFKWFGILWFWLAGWRLVGKLPQDPKMVVISAPHTSNWDGWNLVMCGWVCRVNLRWVVKEEFTRGLGGLFVRATGGLGIKRDKSYNLVEQVANKIREADNLLLLVAPEGTRKRAEHWRTGFYWIAHEADVPMIAARMDYSTKTISFTGPFHATGDIDQDIEPIFDTYRPIRGLHPEKESVMRLRPKDAETEPAQT